MNRTRLKILVPAVLLGGFALLGLRWPAHADDSGEPLDALMKERVNPAFTSVSFQVFHVTPTPGIPREGLVQAVSALEAQAAALARHKVPSDADALPFRFHATNLQRDVGAMLEAAAVGDEEQVQHWFQHVKATCNGCHGQYRD